MFAFTDIVAGWGLGDWALAGFEVLLGLFSTVTGGAILYLVYLDIGAGLRREERADGFLSLLEVGLKQGQTVQHAIVRLSRGGVRAFGSDLHLLAACLERGLPLKTALETVPRLLPARVRAMLRVGEETGNLPKVIPACRKTLCDGQSGTQVNLNNLVVLLFACPIGAVLVGICSVFIIPKFKMIVTDYEVPFPPWTEQMFNLSMTLALVMVLLWLLFCLAGLMRSGGLAYLPWLERSLRPVTHRLRFWLPWQHKRIQRDFSVMLALLLDSGVPEDKAVRLAAESTANQVFMARSERVVKDLRAGVKLTEAVQWLDDAGEFRWRLRNAAAPQRGFFAALAGWHESLDAKAFQQEQAVSQTLTTSFILLNGLMAGLMALGLFRLLLAVLEEVALW